MAVYNFKPQKTTNYLEEGKYTGTVECIRFFEDKGYFSFDIRTNNVVFNTSFAVNNLVFNSFAAEFVDENGDFLDDELIGSRVVFAVKDGAHEPQLRSRVVMIKAI